MDKINFAVVGTGSIGKRHIAVLDADPRANIVAICDSDEEVVKKMSVLYDNLPYYTDYSEMLDSIEADVINVVTPHAWHAPMSIEALKKGYHVLVEKPMAIKTSDCLEMNNVSDETGKKLWVVKQNRFNIPIKMTTELLQEGKLGKVFMVKCDVLWNRYQGYYDDSPWRGTIESEGGAVFTQASHFIDLLVWWFGDVTKANGMIQTQNHTIEIEDAGVAELEFENGTLGSFVWTTNVFDKNYEGSITIIGEKGTVKIGGKYLNKIEFWDVENVPLDPNIDYSDKPNSYGKYQGTSSNHEQVIASILDELLLGKVGAVDGFEGVKSIRAIEKIYDSARAKK